MRSRQRKVVIRLQMYMVYTHTSTFWNCLCKNGCVAVETRVHTSPKSLAFKIVTQIIICMTTKNARESLGLMHTPGSEPSMAPSAKEAHGSGVGEEKAFQFQR